MKINWGTGIAIFYSLFVLAMVTMVVKSTHNKPHMVQEDYYKRDINYESFRQKRQNTENLDVRVEVKSKAGEDFIQLGFPQEFGNVNGQVTLFRPSDETLDRNYKLLLDETGAVKIPVGDKLISGNWKIQLDWTHQGKEYFLEKNIEI